MAKTRLLWHDYRYFPYERLLAEREAGLFFGAKPVETDGGIEFPGKGYDARTAARLTYFKAVECNGTIVVPDQAKLEVSANGNGQRWLPHLPAVPSLRRQSTRYSAHGLHDYRGKFNPQVVRAIGNLFGLEPGMWVLDPFCGSGTTLLECCHIGWNGLGLDINPLGVLIANAKVTAFTPSPATLQRQCQALVHRLQLWKAADDWRKRLPEPDYLLKWFREPVLVQIDAILRAVEEVRPARLRDVFRVCLSDLCRDVSLQDPGDLRIRRRKNPPDNFPVIQMFEESIRSKVGCVARARQQIQPRAGAVQLALLGDTRQAATSLRPAMREHGCAAFDAAITSPPYATALPYMDTQRLSLALLGLVGSAALRRGEKQLIGNREIHDKERTHLERQLRENVPGLPKAAHRFCLRLLELADNPKHGFRRRNVPALVFKYLADMACMFASVRSVLLPKARYGLLVGRNTTELQGEEVLIDTPQLLADIAGSRGWEVEEMLTFDTYQRFDVHKENSIREEVLLVLRRPTD